MLKALLVFGDSVLMPFLSVKQHAEKIVCVPAVWLLHDRFPKRRIRILLFAPPEVRFTASFESEGMMIVLFEDFLKVLERILRQPLFQKHVSDFIMNAKEGWVSVDGFLILNDGQRGIPLLQV